MDNELENLAEMVIMCAHLLLGEYDGRLSAKQSEAIKAILASSERFIHLYAECANAPFEELAMKVRHDIGNELTPMRGYSELLVMGVIGSLNEKQKTYVRQIVDSTDHIRIRVEALVRQARALMEDTAVKTA